MYTVEFYEDKNARVNKNKIFLYVRVLEEYGTRAGKPIVKHIDGDLWELRPLSNRIFFFYWRDNKFVLVHYYKEIAENSKEGNCKSNE